MMTICKILVFVIAICCFLGMLICLYLTGKYFLMMFEDTSVLSIRMMLKYAFYSISLAVITLGVSIVGVAIFYKSKGDNK